MRVHCDPTTGGWVPRNLAASSRELSLVGADVVQDEGAEALYLEPFLRAFLLGIGSGVVLEGAHVAMQVIHCTRAHSRAQRGCSGPRRGRAPLQFAAAITLARRFDRPRNHTGTPV